MAVVRIRWCMHSRQMLRKLSTYSEVEHARLLGLAEVLALGNLSVGVKLSIGVSKVRDFS